MRVLPRTLVTVVALAAAVLVPTSTPVAAAVAEGCPADRPTRLGGSLLGYPDNERIDVLVGIELKDSRLEPVNYDGSAFQGPKTYSVISLVNSHLPATGSTTSGATTWGIDTGPFVHTSHPAVANPNQGQLICVAANVTMAYFELYPRNPEPKYGGNARTNKAKYGSAMHFQQPIRPGVFNDIPLRLPVKFETYGGNTGSAVGYVTYKGGVPDPAAVSIRAWSLSLGPSCGIEGFSAGPDKVVLGATAMAYRMAGLAGGQCGQKAQRYKVIARLGGLVQTKYVYVARGKDVRADFAF